MSTPSSSSLPPEPELLPFDALGHLRTDGVSLLGLVADHGVDQDVPSCPGWRFGDLAWHVGKVWNFWGRIVADGIDTLDGVRALGEAQRPTDDELLIEWVASAHTAVYSALTRADDEREVWTWTGANRPVAWVQRRMAHETAVHRWDASDAVGVPYEIPVAVAADGIDEFLMWFAARRSDGAAPVGGTVHLHCTDTAADISDGSDDRSLVAGEWLVSRLDESGIAFTREHAKGDAAVRGRANDLLLWLWGRDGGPVEILGDTGVAERFRSFPVR